MAMLMSSVVAMRCQAFAHGTHAPPHSVFDAASICVERGTQIVHHQ